MSSRLSPAEKVWAIERLRENQTGTWASPSNSMPLTFSGIENTQFKWHQVVECMKDPQTWMLSLITVSSNVPNGAVSSYQATLINFLPAPSALSPSSSRHTSPAASTSAVLMS
jgi:hypothetical protein